MSAVRMVAAEDLRVGDCIVMSLGVRPEAIRVESVKPRRNSKYVEVAGHYLSETMTPCVYGNKVESYVWGTVGPFVIVADWPEVES